MKTYALRFIATKKTIQVSYRKGVLCRVDMARAKLTPEQFQNLHKVVPLQECDLDQVQKALANKVLVTPLVTRLDALPNYKEFVERWFDFYNRQFGFDPQFTGTDGRALKQIIKYLAAQAGTQDNAHLATWHALLTNWHKLDEFTRRKAELPYLQSHLNNILIQLKHAQTGTSTSKSAANDFRKEV